MWGNAPTGTGQQRIGMSSTGPVLQGFAVLQADMERRAVVKPARAR